MGDDHRARRYALALQMHENLRPMNSKADYQPSAGAMYLAGSVPLFIVGGLFLANTNESPAMFGTAALLCFAFAVYLLLVGAVARGIQVARSGTGQAP